MVSRSQTPPDLRGRGSRRRIDINTLCVSRVVSEKLPRRPRAPLLICISPLAE